MGNRTAIITGSANGIGFECAKRFFEEGYNVVVSDINQRCRESAKTIDPDEKRCISVLCDVSRLEDVENLFKNAIDTFGTVDVLVNNAGITRDARFMDITDESWDLVMNVNLKSMFYTCKKAVEIMLNQGGGAIVNLSSLSGQIGNFGQANYAASKAGVMGLTKTLATEYASKSIRVNAVAPGFIKTEMVMAMPEKVRSKVEATIPLRRGGQPQEVANVVYFLASDEASFVTGQTIAVNGGLFMG